MIQLPRHLAIIMDGNGRWATEHNHPRSFGHVKGTRVAKKIITECSKIGIEWLTLFAFSSENWGRPATEVQLLMQILNRYLRKETNNLIHENIRVHVIGDIEALPVNTQNAILETVERTSQCSGLQLVFAISYGARAEITKATRNIARLVAEGKLKVEEINEDLVKRNLSSFPAPDPDLVIRTSGEKRLSNFLLWQSAYSEFWFTKKNWPDFSCSDLHMALTDFSMRNRRFGGLQDQETHDNSSPTTR